MFYITKKNANKIIASTNHAVLEEKGNDNQIRVDQSYFEHTMLDRIGDFEAGVFAEKEIDDNLPDSQTEATSLDLLANNTK